MTSDYHLVYVMSRDNYLQNKDLEVSLDCDAVSFRGKSQVPQFQIIKEPPGRGEHTSGASDQNSMIASVRVDVCAGGHSLIVTKDGESRIRCRQFRRPTSRARDAGHPQSLLCRW